MAAVVETIHSDPIDDLSPTFALSTRSPGLDYFNSRSILSLHNAVPSPITNLVADMDVNFHLGQR